MNNQDVIKFVLKDLHQAAEPERKALSKTYYPTSMEVIGVTNPKIKLILKKLKTEIRDWSLRMKADLCIDLASLGIFECQQIAYELIGKDRKLMASLSQADVEALDQYQDNWVSVDSFSAYVLGVAWRLGIISDHEILLKSDSRDFWIRRQALVATLGWNQKARGGTGNAEKTMLICLRHIDDHQDMINKAMSWALRELSKTNRAEVVQFMNDFDNRLHNRVRREVWNKLNTGLKNPK